MRSVAIIPTDRPKRQHVLRADGGFSTCMHGSITFSEQKRTVECGLCGRTLDPFEALKILSRPEWWAASSEERRLELEEKRVTKVQCAAISALYDFGIDPEEYEKRWNKERDKRAASAPKEEPSLPVPVPEAKWQW